MLRKTFYAMLFLGLIGFSAPLPAQGTPEIAGTYWVRGTNPGNRGHYRGTAAITKEGDQYRVHWDVGFVYDGIGKLSGNTFTVEWGTADRHVGTVTYTVLSDHVLKGTWYTAKNPNSLGTEVLTPKK